MKHTTSFAWTDGASSGNPGPSGWAVLLDGKLTCGRAQHATNNEMELFAVYQAVMICPANNDLTIVTDSQLVVNWLTNRYRMNRKHLWDMRDLILETCKLKGVTLNLVKTKGHAHDEYNNLVDQAARAQSRLAKLELLSRKQFTPPGS